MLKLGVSSGPQRENKGLTFVSGMGREVNLEDV
jgi:hypothetical protein